MLLPVLLTQFVLVALLAALHWGLGSSWTASLLTLLVCALILLGLLSLVRAIAKLTRRRR